MMKTNDLRSIRDLFLFELDSVAEYLNNVLSDITDEEYQWEPLTESEQILDRSLPVEQKRVWRVYETDGAWKYDYSPEEINPPPFTSIAWMMNHIAQTADMYLYCIKTEKPEGVDLRWDDLPVPKNRYEMSKYAFEVIGKVGEYLLSMKEAEIISLMNKLTPAPWGEMRPTYKNIWGGIIEHIVHHSIQIAARKDGIRYDG